MSMIQTLIKTALRGFMRELRINPRDLRLTLINDEGEHTLATVDARRVQQLLGARRLRQLTLRIRLGDVAYDIEVGR